MNYGRIKNGVVLDTATDPNTQFHPILAAEFVEIPDHVKAGWTFDGTEYAPPVVADPVAIEPEPIKRSISAFDFKDLFTFKEQVKIEELIETDVGLRVFYSRINDVRLETIYLDDQRTIDGVNYTVKALAEAGVVSDVEQRISEILGGGNANA